MTCRTDRFAVCSSYPPTVLVVEDDVAVRRLTTSVLAGLGYDAIEAEGGPAAILRAGEHENIIANRGILDEGVQLLPKPFTVQDLAQKIHDVLAS